MSNTPRECKTSSSSSSSGGDDDTDRKQTEARPLLATLQRKGIDRRRGDDIRNGRSQASMSNNSFYTVSRVSNNDGRVEISINEARKRGYLAKTIGAASLENLRSKPEGDPERNRTLSSSSSHREGRSQTPSVPNQSESVSDSAATCEIPRPKLNIVIMVIGSRGDVQPFIKIGKILKEEHGHRVRIATHPAFRSFVQKEPGLEFFSIGGDPAELMAFMVKNPGMTPSLQTIRGGEIGRRRDQMAKMFDGFWRACINATDDEDQTIDESQPFVADAVIANPPCFAHFHCAERLGIPLHLMFTFPYTPTQAFPHPFANIKKPDGTKGTNVDPGYINFMSYPLVEMMTWQGLGDLVNAFRVRTLGLEPVSTLWAPGQLYRQKVPHTYLWSPGLIPKPKDWGLEISIAGFVFLERETTFEPPEDLVKFLDAGEPPVYIGFGSVVVDDPEQCTKMIYEAVEKAGVRAVIPKGLGLLGNAPASENIYILENIPHDWLFTKVSAVVHHGGAGTTAVGLKYGKPTMIVPFFGDQQFWGTMVENAGAGTKAIPYKDLTLDTLTNGIRQCLTNNAKKNADKIAKVIEAEGDGAKNAVKSFHRSLVLQGEHSMRCSILEDRAAVWSLKNTNLRLSALAALILVEKQEVSWEQLRLIRHNEWNDFEGPGEPLTGGMTAIAVSLIGIATGIGGVPFRMFKSIKRRKHEGKKILKSKQAHGKRSSNSNCAIDHAEYDNSNAEENEYIDGSAKISEIEDSGAPAKNDDKATKDAPPWKHTNGIPANETNNEGNNGDGSGCTLSTDGEENAAEEFAQDIGKGIMKSGNALARMPIDLLLAVAQGFHNAPRLYGDTTVRRPTRITGLHSGFKAAAQELTFGIYDGFTGLVTLPYVGGRDDGVTGFVKGVGMGVIGFVLKDLAAIIGPFAYTFKGAHKELLKVKQPTQSIRKARMVQGQRELWSLGEEVWRRDEEAVSHGWGVVQQFWGIREEQRAGGLRGCLAAWRRGTGWQVNGGFENIRMAEEALGKRRRGEDLDKIFAGQHEAGRATDG